MRCSPYSLFLLLALTACPAAPGSPPTASPAPSLAPSLAPTASPRPESSSAPPAPLPTPLPTGATPSATASPTPAGGSVVLPTGLAQLRFAPDNDRFLDRRGESTRWQVELLDNQGQILAWPEGLILLWESSRPQDFSVSPDGLITAGATVDSGFSEISARIPDTDWEARAVINVAQADVGGGGGGSGGGSVAVNQPPVITSLTPSSTSITGVGSLLRLNAAATDPDSTLSDASYTWSSETPGGEAAYISTSGPQVYWRSPATAGDYVLRLTVSDGRASATQTVTITVITGEATLDVN